MSSSQEENSPAVEDERRDDDIGECEIDELKKNYQVITFIGKGSFGRVFKIEENTTGKYLALKLIRKPEPVENDNDEEFSREYSLLYIEREKRILKNIGCHPFLVTLHDSFETLDHVGLIMNYVEGIPIIDYPKYTGTVMPESHAAFYIAEISLALHHLHKKGIIHRDLNCNNILIDLDGHVRLIDYGSAVDGLSFETKTSFFDYTCNEYCKAPEITAHIPYGHQCDWYALGVILCAIITGVHPFLPAEKQTNSDEADDEVSDADYIFMVEAMVKMEFQFEKTMSEEAYSLLEKLLQFHQDDRLGRYDDENRMEIAECAFLKHIDWAKLERREVDPPFKPLVKNADQSKDTPEKA